MSPLLRFVLALSIVLAAIAAPASLSAPFGVDPVQTTVGFLAFAIGLCVTRGPDPSRSSIVATSIAFAAVCGLDAWIARVVAPRLARGWPLPSPELGAATIVSPWCGSITLFVTSFALGVVAARMWRASGGEGRAVPALFGAIVGCIVAASFCWRSIGPSGTLVLAGVLALSGSACRVVMERVGSTSPVGGGSFVASAALGIFIGTLQAPFEIAAGGSLIAVVYGVVIAGCGAIVGAILRPVANRNPRLAFVVAILSLGVTAIVAAIGFPSSREIVFASAKVAEGAGGLLPGVDMLHPLPLCLAIAAASAFVLGAMDSTRSFGVVIVVAAVARLFPRHELAPLVASTFVVALAVARGFASASLLRTGAKPLIATALLVVGWILATISLHRLDSFELDGARFGVDAETSRERSAPVHEIDGVSLPLSPPRIESVDRLIRALLAWRDEPEACLVLGPGGGVWVERLLAASSCRVDYVTPYANEARWVLAGSAARDRLRTFAIPPRRFLAASDDAYERVLICPAEPPWHRAGATLTAELRELAVDRLAADGVAAQLFGIAGMQPANVVFRLMGDAFLAVEDGVLIVDHPRSIDPQFALLFTRGALRLDVDRARARIERIRSESPHLTGANFDARGLIAGVFADTAVLRFSSRVLVPNRDDRPWMAASLHARVIPDPLYVPSNLANLIGYHAFVESRIDGPAEGRRDFLAAARRDHEAVHHWLLRRAGAPEQFRSDASEPPSATAELEALVQCLAKSPDSDLFGAPILAAIARLEVERRRGEARALLDRAASIEARSVPTVGSDRHPPGRFALARAVLHARHGRRAAAESMLSAVASNSSGSAEAKRELATLLAYSGRSDRARAREILADPNLGFSSDAPVCDRWCIARRWLLARENAAPSDRSDAAARYRALPRR